LKPTPARFVKYTCDDAIEKANQYTKMLYIRGEGDAFLLPDSNLLVKYKRVF